MATGLDDDLPRLFLRPSAATLLATLRRLERAPRIWGGLAPPRAASSGGSEHESAAEKAHRGREESEFLSAVVRSPLAWIEDDEVQEEIWALASRRVAERCGRSALGDVTRSWPFLDPAAPSSTTITTTITTTISSSSTSSSSTATPFHLAIREPALTGDSLGHKTWGSSYLLAQHLPRLAATHLSRLFGETLGRARPRVLELGAGTGLLGLAAAALWRAGVVLTDVGEIVPNLAFNAAQNRGVVEERGGAVDVGVLEWGGRADEHVLRGGRMRDGYRSHEGGLSPGPGGSDGGSSHDEHSRGGTASPGRDSGYDIILVADGIYDEAAPALLSSAVARHLTQGPDARLVMMAPQRDSAAGRLLAEFRGHLERGASATPSDDGDGLECVHEEWLVVEDDWSEDAAAGDNSGDDDEQVRCWLGVYARKRAAGWVTP